MLAALAFAERFVAGSRYMAGDVFPMADIAAVTITLSAAGSLDWGTLPNLKRWFDEVVDRPYVRAGLAAFNQPGR
ncbi:glutathione binding-like protein [Paucibacter sp. R3-3]|uniref:Glutathione binding-like protein n=1 Tax=Roseateles agri TaxID=3098619 RepID=A0ABU5DSH5_9BURK|nr:glutathione binding-like protein [Paucibacter sp. R3-3]MDY0748711.1 glutathione binding-like protein [Paucibacter sp. R3-3]